MEKHITIDKQYITKLMDLAYGVGYASGQLETNNLDSSLLNDLYEAFIEYFQNE